MLILVTLFPVAAAARDEPSPRVSSGFGARADPLHGRRATHRGVDMPGAAGTLIVAAAEGIVRVAGRRGRYGELVEVAHPDGTTTRYAHLSRILVRSGEAVAQGQVIGRMGSTGRSTGSHLHFEYRINGAAVDPLRYVAAGSHEAPQLDLPPAPTEPPHRSRFSQARAGQTPSGSVLLPGGGDALHRHLP